MESPQPKVSTPPTSVSLPKDTSAESDYTVSVSSVRSFFQTIREHEGDFVVAQGIERDLFQKIEAARERRRAKIRFHYQPAQRRLFVSVPTFPHEMVNGKFSAGIYRDLNSMGLTEYDLEATNATTFLGDDGSSGEADICFLPPARSDDIGGWPTLVIETGVSQSLESLHSKMRWWFRASGHQAKIVLLVKATASTRSICLEKYMKDVPQTRIGATSTRTMPGLTLQLRQSITITPQPGSPVVYDVLGGPLVLEFALLFLRPADAARGERDIVLTTPWLAMLAERVWTRSRMA